ncbi:SDR family oxidoreductase [Nocardia sp. 2]|uniref:SDR family oxidoreductase n=1 Tax=Nocardia acididurans TaxID=2802282 RepID=A0ABS1M6A3_9NOCA|nr:SDR family oxidoreductase [Nocardia acididurans]MBL1074663.1 SDR family oxidoreductase [Nocardia acididurans]
MIESDGRVVVVTGAAAGIGAAVAAELAAGARTLALWDRDPRVHEVAAEIARRATEYAATTGAVRYAAASGIAEPEQRQAVVGIVEPEQPQAAAGIAEAALPQAVAVIAAEVDVADRKSVEAAFDRLTAAHGPADVLVHAAGVMDAGTALDITPESWDRSFAVNATGTMHVTQRAARDMTAAGRGAIVVVSSNAAATPRVGMAAYCASKAAATAFTRALALQVAPFGVRVNLVSPGSTNTAMLRGLQPAADTGGVAGSSALDEAVRPRPLDPAAHAALLDGDPGAYRLGIPLRRIAEPADIAAAIRFLVSDDARHITMHDLRVDGGATLDM